MNRTPPNLAQQQIPAKRQKLYQKCNNPHHECSGTALEGYSFCIKHILQDSSAPFKQCAFVYNTNGKQCYYPAPKKDRRDVSYCPAHERRALVAKIKSESKGVFVETPERHLLNLTHYVKTGENGQELDDEHKTLDPFEEIDVVKVNAGSCAILDYESESESDVEPTLASDALRGTVLDESDTESIGSVHEDPLRHAGIYTDDEVICTSREKLKTLQNLYIDQFKRLQYVLKEKRRRYLHALKIERETHSNIHSQAKKGRKERKTFEKLKALYRYHRKSGVEAILHKKFQEKKTKAAGGIPQKPPSVQKCIFTEGGVKCGERTLPSAKHCMKHILKDEKQVLFRACGVKNADVECHEPVPVIFDTNCVFHMELPPVLNLEPMKFTKEAEKPEPTRELHPLSIDTATNSQGIDPDDDMAGLMREMNDPIEKKMSFNESVASETSTDTAFSLNTDRDDVAAT